MALDITTQVEGMVSFRKFIRKHGTAALSIKPHLAVVAQVADRSMTLRCGRLVGLVATEQILARPQEECDHRFMSGRTVCHHGSRAAAGAQTSLPGGAAGARPLPTSGQ